MPSGLDVKHTYDFYGSKRMDNAPLTGDAIRRMLNWLTLSETFGLMYSKSPIQNISRHANFFGYFNSKIVHLIPSTNIFYEAYVMMHM